MGMGMIPSIMPYSIIAQPFAWCMQYTWQRQEGLLVVAGALMPLGMRVRDAWRAAAAYADVLDLVRARELVRLCACWHTSIDQ